MSVKTGMSQVKFKVRYNALLLREFTVSDMVRATGLNPESIRTELQRMKQEGLLVAAPHPEKHEKRGGHPSIYRLADDPEMRLALSESIEAFYPPLPADDQPTSRHYVSAKQLIDDAQRLNGPQRRTLLEEAERNLEIAEQAEGGSLASDSIKAYLQFERARLAYLEQESKLAQELLNNLSQFFASTNNATMLQKVIEFQICLVTWTRQRDLGIRGLTKPDALARCLLNAIEEVSYETESPLALFLIDLLCELSQTPQEKINTEVVVSVLESSKQKMDALSMKVDNIYQHIVTPESKAPQHKRETEKMISIRRSELGIEDWTTAHLHIPLQWTRND